MDRFIYIYELEYPASMLYLKEIRFTESHLLTNLKNEQEKMSHNKQS